MANLGQHAWADLADRMAEMIVDGRLPPGRHLVEAEVADQFGVSRGPVRTALAWLERQGLAAPQGKRGLAVVRMTASDVDELYEVRIALEITALRRVAARPDNLDLGELRDRLEALEGASGSPDVRPLVIARADLAFHRQLCVLSGNARLTRTWDSLSHQILLVLGTLQSGDLSPLAHLFAHHASIYQALDSGDSALAERLLLAHLHESREYMLSSVDE